MRLEILNWGYVLSARDFASGAQYLLKRGYH
jgi:hypothetical protein